ncbi:MAG TPA: type II toxin-antitoxin system RelE/ParE family toxin [Caulobacteraceae bacterium]|nr:type II toxin-antitoxin system RelE/ParE family toxin [Caulobacteraceae bacterium]
MQADRGELRVQPTSSTIRRTPATAQLPSCRLGGLRDNTAQARVRVQLRRVEAGNLGDCKAVGEGVQELRIHFGPGYRVYFGRHGNAVVILLCGGDKSSQPADIRQAKSLWAEWKRRQA